MTDHEAPHTGESSVVEMPRRWWQKRRYIARCERCGWRSAPHVQDASGVGDFKLTFALIDHRVTTQYRCMPAQEGER